MRSTPTVLHLDLDAFYAAVEQRDKPSLRGRPVVVGGIGGRGVVATASYEARVHGVRSAMPTAQARSRCPHAAYLAPRFAAYQSSSLLVMAQLRKLSPLVEPLSLDEAFVDLAPSCPDLDVDTGRHLAETLRAQVQEVTGGLTASVGMATSKLVAKIASELDKPDGAVVVPPGSERELLSPLPATVVPGVGPATAARLRRLGAVTVGDVAGLPVTELVRELGHAHGETLHRLARAEDDRPVVPERETKSVSVEDTFGTDVTDPVLLAALADRMSARVVDRLQRARLSGRTVTLKVRLHDFTTSTRAATLTGPTDSVRVVTSLVRRLLAETDTSGGVRLLGVGVSGLADWIQDDLFDGVLPGGGDQISDRLSSGPLAADPPADGPEGPDAAAGDPVLLAVEAFDRHGRHPGEWHPGADVVHAEHGRGWVWGAGRGRVTVRFETAATPSGPVRTFAADDPALEAAGPEPVPDVSAGGVIATGAASASVPTMPDSLPSGPPSGPPLARELPTERTHHGDTVVDPYEWLRDKDSDEVRAHLEAENAYTEQQTAHLADLRQQIFDEIRSRTQETDMSVPTRKGEWWYYSRTVEGQQYGVHCRCPADTSQPGAWEPPTVDGESTVPGEEILLDANVEAEGHEFFSLGTFDVSPDGRLLAYSTDVVGDERYTLRVKDLGTGDLLPDQIPDTFHSTTWSRDASTVFYVTVDDAWRPCKVWRHRLGAPVSDDEVVWHETDERFWVGVGTTRSERYVVVAAGSKTSSEMRVLDGDDPAGEPRLVAGRRDGVEYSIEHARVAGRDVFLILHNDGAENFALAEAPVDSPTPDHWIPVLPHRGDVRLDGVAAFATHLVVSYRRDALPRTAILPLTDDGYGESQELTFDEELFTCVAAANPEWSQPHVRIAYTSFVTPAAIYDCDVASGKRVLRKQQPVLGGYDAADYEQHREWATAPDGTRVPISVVCRTGTPRDGTAPCLLYGYGSYEISIDPGFTVSRLSLLDRGMVFAVAHVRGGGEMGRSWYDDGKLLAKRNSFTDFVACARHLAETRWTSPDRLVAMGGSAGGLLMGAVVNLAPDAFAGILAAVPFVDALTSVLDPSLPLTVTEWDEWGDPLHDPDVYTYIRSYSPYENVAALDYPPILATTSLNDTRVLYVEPAKWVARLRAVGDGAPQVLLKTEMSAGHGGVSGRYEAWKERAFEYAWILDTVGLGRKPA